MYYRTIGLTALTTLMLTVGVPVSFILFPPTQVLAQTPNNQEAEADRLFKQGAEYLNNQQVAQARDSFQKALTLYRAAKKPQGESAILLLFGITYGKEADYETAINYYQQALAIIQKLPNRQNEYTVFRLLGDTYQKSKNYPKAIEYNHKP